MSSAFSRDRSIGWGCPLLVVAFTALAVSQQQSSANRPKFDVASVKPCKVNTFGTNGGGTSPGRLTAHCAAVVNLVRQAYAMFRDGKMNERGRLAKVEGGPSWAYSDRFEIEAKADSRLDWSVMQGPMMQSLLEDRFHLKVHSEIRDVPAYVLTVAKEGIRLPAAKQSCILIGPGHPPPPNLRTMSPSEFRGLTCGHADTNGQEFHLHGATIADLCEALSWIPFDRQMFVDKTGVSGRFDFDFKQPNFVPEEPGGIPINPLELQIEAYRSALGKYGLKIESGKAQGEFLIIDHLERPSSN